MDLSPISILWERFDLLEARVKELERVTGATLAGGDGCPPMQTILNTTIDHANDQQIADEIGTAKSVAECEKVADEISNGIKRAMPCDCRDQGSLARCGNCGRD